MMATELLARKTLESDEFFLSIKFIDYGVKYSTYAFNLFVEFVEFVDGLSNI